MTSNTKHTLYYAHDPMCSWCWGFKPTWQSITQQLPDSVEARYVLGGLAPDTSEPMPKEMQEMLQQIWHSIAMSIPGTQFNHDFWTNNTPRRATYPACRAVLAAASQRPELEEAMITAIQEAYYLNAKNPSNDEILIELADNIGCDVNSFKSSLNDISTVTALNDHIRFAQRLGAQGFPSLFLEPLGKRPVPVAINYQQPRAVLDQIDTILAR